LDKTTWQAIIVILIVVAIFVNSLLHRRAQRQRLELIHQERLAAMDKGIPLPELPVDPPPQLPPWMRPQPMDPHLPLLFGILLLCGGLGGVVALIVIDNQKLRELWSLPFPFALMGLGLIFYYFLTRDRKP
jgi:hypothetical protein